MVQHPGHPAQDCRSRGHSDHCTRDRLHCIARPPTSVIYLGLGWRRLEEEEKQDSTSVSALTVESVIVATKAEASHFASTRPSSTFSFSSLPSSFTTFLLGMRLTGLHQLDYEVLDEDLQFTHTGRHAGTLLQRGRVHRVSEHLAPALASQGRPGRCQWQGGQ